MAKIDLPESFQHSYTNLLQYPNNFIPRGTGIYPSTLQSLYSRLDEAENDLFLSESCDPNYFEVPIRDFRSVANKGTIIEKKELHSPIKLAQWLDTELTSVEKQQVKAYKKDPSCRFIYIYSETSRDRLRITRSSLMELFTYHQVMPTYLDFIFVFGIQSDPTDLRFSAFRELKMIRDPPRGYPIPDLGRSGRQYQLCYNLKGVTQKKKDDMNRRMDEWSIRQAAIHHQFDIVYGTTLWIVTKGRRDILDRFKDMTGPDGRKENSSFGTVDECFRSSMGTHLLYCHWSTEGWRWYVRWLENVVEEESDIAVYGPRGPGYAHKTYRPSDFQDLQYWHDKTNEAVMVLEANVDIVTSLQHFYLSLSEDTDFPQALKINNTDEMTSFRAALGEIISDFKMQISRAKLLATIISDRKDLVLQHLQGQAAERTEELNINLEREAIGMRIITIATLVYLPATFVSTFFSTDVIKYQKQGDEMTEDGSFSPMAMKRWLQVALPLTFLTLFLAWLTYKLEENRRYAKLQGVQFSNTLNRPSARENITNMADRIGIFELLNNISWMRRPTLPSYISRRKCR